MAQMRENRVVVWEGDRWSDRPARGLSAAAAPLSEHGERDEHDGRGGGELSEAIHESVVEGGLC